ncbi:MAG TPA: ATP-binding protein, partial [Candidatus Brocadiaceae bacterium]
LWKRMCFGYIIIALFMMVMSFYLIYRMNHLNKITDSIMKVNIPSIENGEKLVDSLLEQVRNEKKFIITNDDAFLDLFEKKKKDFCERLKSIEDSLTNREKNVFINKIKELHNKYLTMVSKDILLVDTDEIIPPDPRHEEEKKRTLDQLTESINKLILTVQTDLIKKIELFQKIGYKSTKMSGIIILCAIIFGAAFAYFFTRSVCSPIKVLTDATDRIAQGDLDYRIDVTSHDEIGALGIAFNQMCNKLKEIDRMKSEFVSNISHNLKTPLTAIREASDLLLEKIAGPLSEPQIKLLNIMKEESFQLTMMINDLLDISRVEAGLMRYNFQYSDIHEVIRKSTEEIRFLAEIKNINIRCLNGSPSLSQILLDRDKIAQVMDNLLSNAIKFTPAGGSIAIQVNEVESYDIPHIFKEQNRLNNIRSFVKISISDTGIGIPVEYHKKIFDKFQQVNNKGKGGIKGTGLGLSIAKHIILDHGGDIWVENNTHGLGSTFYFTIPSNYDYALGIS